MRLQSKMVNISIPWKKGRDCETLGRAGGMESEALGQAGLGFACILFCSNFYNSKLR